MIMETIVVRVISLNLALGSNSSNAVLHKNWLITISSQSVLRREDEDFLNRSAFNFVPFPLLSNINQCFLNSIFAQLHLTKVLVSFFVPICAIGYLII